MNVVRHLPWFFASMLIGLVLIGIGAFVSSSQGFGPPPHPVQVREVDVPEPVKAGLRIECRNDNECIQTSDGDWNDGRGPLRRLFLRVRVYNDGHPTAEGCTVTLRRITDITTKGRKSIVYAGPGLLIWAGDRSAKPEGRVIDHNAKPAVADLFYTIHGGDKDEIVLKDEAYSSLLKFQKVYSFEVVASARNMETVARNIKVRFGSTWDDFEVLSE